ncbi:thymidylate kinase [Streptomyces sp. NPDC004732]|uniref:dTMP kinase n=1 Tax=Streptomyces sp. NPDC004732 TaxID=3154290 RepID=UPI0033A37585
MNLADAYQPIEHDGLPEPLIVLEGVSGIGKSTLARVLIRRLGATGIHTLAPPHSSWSPEVNSQLRALPQFAFYLSGLLHASDRIRQSLTIGPVIADRYASSVIACHSAVHGIETNEATRLLEPFRPYLTPPDHTFYLECSEPVLRQRMALKKGQDQLTSDDAELFAVPGRLKRLLANFQMVAAVDSTAVVIETDGKTPDVLADQILAHLESHRA